MSVIARNVSRSARALHTSARLFNDAPASSSSASSSGSALGFGDYTGRVRNLPTLKISATSRQNVIKPKAKGQTEASGAGAGGSSDGKGVSAEGNRKRGGQPERRKRQDRSPLQSQARARGGQAAPAGAAAEEGDDFFDPVTVAATARSRPAGLKKVDVDFNPVNVKVASKGRRSTNTNEKKPARGRAPREARAPQAVEVEDRSPEGIFGRASLLFPVRRGARDAESSVWAEGVKPEQGMFYLRLRVLTSGQEIMRLI